MARRAAAIKDDSGRSRERPRALARLLPTARARLIRAEALIVATAEHVAPEIAYAALRIDDADERPVTADQP